MLIINQFSVISKTDAKMITQNWVMTFDFVETPFGQCLMACYNKHICYFAFCHDNEGLALLQLQKYWPNVTFSKQSMQPLANIIFSSSTNTCVNLLAIGTVFQASVWQKLLDIPVGNTVSYQYIANQLKKPSATRAVGSAIGKNPLAYIIPCHRVICSSGKLGGYRLGFATKNSLLLYERQNVV
jgi:AraC family transcriptional regulator of adaptative response/methylated-DNA-[protein]-cysteine methyltransferase